MLPALAPYFREETAFARKEALYMRVISYFERSKEWEQAIELCRSLVVQYENDFADNLKVCMRGQGGGRGPCALTQRWMVQRHGLGYNS